MAIFANSFVVALGAPAGVNPESPMVSPFLIIDAASTAVIVVYDMNVLLFYEFLSLYTFDLITKFAHKGNKIARIDKICASKFIKKL
jgi:hypothetical protein